MKKLAIFLVLAMLLSSISVGAAPTSFGVEALVEVPAAGDTGTVTLVVSTDDATAAGTITVSYDNADLSFVAADALNGMCSAKDSGSAVTLVYSCLEAVSGELAVFTFAYDCTESSVTVVDVAAQLSGEEDDSSEQSVTVTIQLPTEAEICPSAGYTDVDTGRWYHEAVDFAVSTGLMNGMTDTTFAPDATTTRAQFVTVLSRIAGADVSAYTGESDFTDVSPKAWYAPYVAWAADMGLVEGDGDGTFRPDSSISRQELVTILARFVGAEGGDPAVLEGFDDADQIARWAKPAAAWAVENGLIQGFANKLDPTGSTTRAQIAQIILNYMN